MAACGGGDSGDTTTASAVPEAKETIDDFAQRYADVGAAAAEGDCDPVDEFNTESLQQVACPAPKDAFTDLKVVDTAGYETGGLIDVTSKVYPEGYIVMAALNEDGQFRQVKDDSTKLAGYEFPQVGTEPQDAEARDQLAADYVTAMREEDCDRWFELAVTPTPDKEKECRFAFGPKSGLADELNADPDAEPELLGETADIAFYGLETGDTYRTLLAERIDGVVREQNPDAPAYVFHSYRAQND